MSSISALSSSTLAAHSPRDRINDQISAAGASGEISATDQGALSPALDSIDSSLAGSRASGTKPSGDMKAKMDALIQKQVDDGTLTEDQATELKSMFAKGADGRHGPHGAHGGAGPEGPPPAQDADDDTTGTSATTSADAASDAVSLFLKQLRDQAEDTTSYSASGNTSKTSDATKSTGLVLNTLA